MAGLHAWRPRKRIRRMRGTRYLDDRSSWRELAEWVRNRDGRRCRQCGRHEKELDDGERLEVHHIKRLSRGGSDRATNLVTLCSTCHGKQPGHSHLRR